MELQEQSRLQTSAQPGVGVASTNIPDKKRDFFPTNFTTSESALHRWRDALPDVHAVRSQSLRVYLTIWNLHGQQAPADLSGLVPTQPAHHIYVIGTAECMRSAEKSFIWTSKVKWEAQVRDHLGEDYMMTGSNNMSAIHVMVFIHRYLWKYCWDYQSAQIATGFANYIGNKGSTQVCFGLGHTTLLFMNAHLAAHQSKMKERTHNLTRILMDSPLRTRRKGQGIHEEYDRVFFFGDLNARLDASREDVDGWLRRGELDECLKRDQLLPLLQADVRRASSDGPAGWWPVFEEAPIDFLPTYKFDPFTNTYDTSKKQRVPAWTDRVLWRRDPKIRPLRYGSVQSLFVSDHRPVFTQFEVDVDLADWHGPPTPEKCGTSSKSSVCSVQ